MNLSPLSIAIFLLAALTLYLVFTGRIAGVWAAVQGAAAPKG